MMMMIWKVLRTDDGLADEENDKHNDGDDDDDDGDDGGRLIANMHWSQVSTSGQGGFSRYRSMRDHTGRFFLSVQIR